MILALDSRKGRRGGVTTLLPTHDTLVWATVSKTLARWSDSSETEAYFHGGNQHHTALQEYMVGRCIQLAGFSSAIGHALCLELCKSKYGFCGILLSSAGHSKP